MCNLNPTTLEYAINDGEDILPKKQKRRDSISVVGPYSRVRVIVAVVVFFFAFAAIGYRMLFG